jgi:hypothetical protein
MCTVNYERSMQLTGDICLIYPANPDGMQECRSVFHSGAGTRA